MGGVVSGIIQTVVKVTDFIKIFKEPLQKLCEAINSILKLFNIEGKLEMKDLEKAKDFKEFGEILTQKPLEIAKKMDEKVEELFKNNKIKKFDFENLKEKIKESEEFLKNLPKLIEEKKGYVPKMEENMEKLILDAREVFIKAKEKTDEALEKEKLKLEKIIENFKN